MEKMENRCPVETTLSLINGKWKLLILKELSQGPVRYNQLKESIPAISTKVLTQQLREMESDGMIIREVFPEIPPHVEYSLSEMGVSIFKIFAEIRRWGLEDDKRNNPKCSDCQSCRPYHL
ncbi:hypothetical protein MsAg5_14930 [Methanosarcinaceae archaeon Ag5]|uniref:HTH hxlR-type domain-containing protein n=1 Tax=Methanolapillus africanus TaxID=3028297 RepID=A0AAE4MKF6_9EURY|nr:hypothetical protein [Methanosarcinaceae archaeon Ag5]